MKKGKNLGTDPKTVLRDAGEAAALGDTARALELFETCIREYVRQKKPFKALGAAKAAKGALKRHPKTQALLIRLLVSMGLMGDALGIFSESSAALKKDESDILRGLSMEEFTGLLEIMELLCIRKGHCIMKQGEPGEDLFIVISGSLEVVRDGERIASMQQGDVFGELGFFLHHARSATVRAARPCELVRIPSQGLRELCGRHSGLRDALEALYHERALKKAGEDLRNHPFLDLSSSRVTPVRLSRGEQIFLDGAREVAIVKHGIIELSFDEKGMRKKRFIKPGSIIERFNGTARASTDVEIIRARLDQEDKAP